MNIYITKRKRLYETAFGLRVQRYDIRNTMFEMTELQSGGCQMQLHKLTQRFAKHSNLIEDALLLAMYELAKSH